MTAKAQTTSTAKTTADKTTSDAPKPAAPADDAQVHEGHVVDDTPTQTKAERIEQLRRELEELDPSERDTSTAQAAPAEPKKESREERRERLRGELAEVDQEARLHGGYKAIPTHVGVLLCGHQVQVTNAAATEHYCDEDKTEVPFTAFHPIPEALREKIRTA